MATTIAVQVRNSWKEEEGMKTEGFDKQMYNRIRSIIKRFNGRIKAFRRVATRYERLPQVYMAFVHLAWIIVYLRIL